MAQLEGSGRAAARAEFPDWRFAPNCGGHPDTYEIENGGIDPGGHLLAAMCGLAPWDGHTIVDLGCGTGFWLGSYATEAARVVGVEPDPALRARAAARIRGLPRIEVLAGSAEHLPLADRSADVVHARFAYFLAPGAGRGSARGAGGRGGTTAAGGSAPRAGGSGGTTAAGGGWPGAAQRAGCDPGLAEVMRVLRPGGSLIVVENDYHWGQLADLLAAAAPVPPQHTASAVDTWWRERGATRHEVRTQWQFASRAELAAVLNIEVPAHVARAWLAQHPTATGLSCGYVLYRVTRQSISRADFPDVMGPGMLPCHVPLVSALWAGSG